MKNSSNRIHLFIISNLKFWIRFVFLSCAKQSHKQRFTPILQYIANLSRGTTQHFVTLQKMDQYLISICFNSFFVQRMFSCYSKRNNLFWFVSKYYQIKYVLNIFKKLYLSQKLAHP
jgi:hypothetical protein